MNESLVDRLEALLRAHAGRAAWAAVDQGAAPLTQLILTPFLLARLGRDNFGLWTFVLTIVSLSQLASGGASMAAIKYVSCDRAQGLNQKVIASIRACVALAASGGSFCAFLLWWATPTVLPYVFAEMARVDTATAMIAFCGLPIAIQEIDNVYSGALRGAERFDLSAKIEIPMRLLMVVAIVCCTLRGADVYSLFKILTALLLAKALLKAVLVATFFGSRLSVLPSFAPGPFKRVFQFGIWQWTQSAGTVLFSAADQLYIGGVLGATALARYSTCLQIAQTVHLFPSVLMQVLFPRISAMGPALSAARGNQILNQSTAAAVMMAACIGIPILLLAHPLLAVWIGSRFADENAGLLSVLTVAHLLLGLNIAAYFVLLGTGRIARSALIVLAAGAAQIIFLVIATPFGLIPAAFNRFIYAGVTALLYRVARFKVHHGN